MAKKLKNLEITKVDVVDRGANQKAHMRLFKRDWLGAVLRKKGAENAPDLEEMSGITETEAEVIREIAERVGASALLAFVRALDGAGEEEPGEDDGLAEEARELAKRYARLGESYESLAVGLFEAKRHGKEKRFIEEKEKRLTEVEGLFSEIGKRGGEGHIAADSWTRIDRAAMDLMRDKPGIVKAIAVDEVCSAHPEWVREYERGRMER